MNKFNQSNKSQMLLPGIWFNYFIDNKLLYIDIHDILNKFWNDIIINLGEKEILLKFKIKYNGKFITIGNNYIINNNDYIKLSSILFNLLNILNEDYKNKLHTKNIVIVYKIMGFGDKKLIINKYNKNMYILINELPKSKIYIYNLPNTMDYKLWGNIISSYMYKYLINIPNTNLFYEIINDRYFKFNGYNAPHTMRQINVLTSSKMKILTFFDYIENNENLKTFTRIINNQYYHFNNGNIEDE
jgi:hypothetical protein